MTYIDFPNAIEDRSKVARAALGYPYQGVFGQSADQIPSFDLGGWGSNGPLLFNPGGFDPVLFATKWQFNTAQNLTKVWGTHTAKAGFYFERITNNQPGNNNSNGFMELNTWGGGSTGNTFADLLLGRTNYYQESTKNALHNIAWNPAWAGHRPGKLEQLLPYLRQMRFTLVAKHGNENPRVPQVG